MSKKDDEILEELRRIRALLEPKPPPPPPKGFKAEFINFVSKYKILGLAVAFVIGLYVGALVQALVADFIMPVIEIAVPGAEWETITLGPFRVGHFAGALITFLIVMLVVFLLIKLTARIGID
ncbi:MAG: MscL family protein [Candidatus Hadarchaeales archaeon]